jgi:TRAP-type C4-dicarboxylate transport system permease small subunit
VLVVLRTLYTRWLLLAELGIITALTTLVVIGALLLAISGWVDPRPLLNVFGLPDLTTLQTLVYTLTLILCLFGAVIAARRASHIAVDAVTPHLKPHIRARVEGTMWLIAGFVSFWIAITAHEYVTQIVEPQDRIILGMGGFYSKQMWRWPAVFGFAWMGLHFVVTGAVRITGRELHEVGLAAPPATVDDGDDGDDGDDAEGDVETTEGTES